MNTGHGKALLRAYDITAASTGDLTSTLKWEQTKAIPTRSSPVTVVGIIYLNGDSGILSAVDFKDGALLYNERITGTSSSSPLYADGKIFYCNEQGVTTVVKPGRTFEKLGSNTLESGIMASPVACGDTLYLRTKAALYAIRQKK